MVNGGAAECNWQVTSASGAVALALLSRLGGFSATMEQGKTIQVRK